MAQPVYITPLVPAHRDPVAVYLAGLSSGSRRTMLSALRTIARMASGDRVDAREFPWHELRHEHASAIRSRLAERYSPSTANKMLAALRGVLKACWRLELMDVESYQRASSVPAVRGDRLPSGRSLTRAELTALFDACGRDGTAAGRRDSAILALLYGTGLRRSEVCAIDLAHVAFGDSSGATVRVCGKGNKERTAYVTHASPLSSWVAARGDADGPLFLPVRKGGRTVVHKRMTSQAIYGLLRKRGREARIESFSPHDLRRTFVSDLLDAGADVSMVQQLAGHAQVTTTQRYDRRPEEARRKAAGLLHVPYVERSEC